MKADSVVFFDDGAWQHLLPLTYTKPVAELRIGINTIKEKWQRYLDVSFSYSTAAYLASKYPLQLRAQNLFINGSVLPNDDLVNALNQLAENEALVQNNQLIAFYAHINDDSATFSFPTENDSNFIPVAFPIVKINHWWDLFLNNDAAIKADFGAITKGRSSQPISENNTIIGSGSIFIEEGAEVEACILNATKGPIYIGRDALVMEGSMLRGPLAVCENAVIKMGAKIYGPTTIGPYCKVGGEINNTLFQAFSNKAHDGYLGNSIIGEWCNLGADTNCSNLKNNYGQVKCWNYASEQLENSGQQFLGLLMGDHAKCSINTMFNTGTTVSAFSNVFGAGFPNKFIPSFSWGNNDTYDFDKAMDTANRVMARRNKELTAEDRDIYKTIFEMSAAYRKF